jgi:peptidoglycan/xylan/chitin deacetylase (PgdA/CDA1 family)
LIPFRNLLKKYFIKIFWYTHLSKILFRISFNFHSIRVIHYHCTPEIFKNSFDEHLKLFSKFYSPVTENDLSRFFETKKWHKNKPGLIISFDDGLRSNFDYACPLLEKHGFVGWFFIPSNFILDPTLKFTIDNKIKLSQHYSDNRYCVSIEEMNLMKKNHVIGGHTASHHRFNNNDLDKVLEKEITTAKIDLQNFIDKEIKAFSWVGGELKHYTKNAFNKLLISDFYFIFFTNYSPINRFTNPKNINRTNIESEMSIPEVYFRLSGIFDIIYFIKRLRIYIKLNY